LDPSIQNLKTKLAAIFKNLKMAIFMLKLRSKKFVVMSMAGRPQHQEAAAVCLPGACWSSGGPTGQ
jgi:hypothetical protein